MTDFRGLARVSVLTVGDVMLDEYVWGQVDRISPEAPVPVVEVKDRTYVPGGAANAASGVAALGARSLVCGVVGDDAAAIQTRDSLRRRGVDVSALVVDASRPTTTKTRVIAHSQQIVRTDVEAHGLLSAAIELELIERANALVAQVDAVLVSDYAKGVVSQKLARDVIATANDLGKPVVVDPKGLDYRYYRGATVITPNAHDAARSANVHVRTDADLLQAAGRLRTAAGGAALLVTRGAAGMRLFADDSAVDIEAEAQEVYDVTGAGDTVVAVLAVALAAGVALERAVRLANSAAAVAVAKVGTAAVTLAELEARLDQVERRTPAT